MQRFLDLETSGEVVGRFRLTVDCVCFVEGLRCLGSRRWFVRGEVEDIDGLRFRWGPGRFVLPMVCRR